uniref:Predicted nucleotidyltransferase n=1 Tax=uncultured Thiotrichaceae bacterium TaxID=298394 RepID=A0A6S6UCF3_9GAMM|nr:MAG: Predicted nucleotidyltransferase [uncultured Thiotrichaceae bacterium]
MFHKDFSEFIELLNNHKVEYLLVGGYALGIHGYPRYTGDLDIWIKPEPKNAQKVIKVLHEFGFAELDLDESDLTRIGNVIQLGYPPLRIDLLTQPDGVNFADSYAQRMELDYGGLMLHVISLGDFKKNKAASGRPKDLADLQSLE